MKPLDEELKSALKRREPPPGFRERVAARLADPARTRLHGAHGLAAAFRPTWIRWAAVMAAACLVLMGAWVIRRREQQRKAEAIQRQVMYALRLAAGKFNGAMQAGIVRLGAPTSSRRKANQR